MNNGDPENRKMETRRTDNWRIGEEKTEEQRNRNLETLRTENWRLQNGTQQTLITE